MSQRRSLNARTSLLSDCVREVYAAHWVLWGFGFEPKDIFVTTHFVANARPPGRYASVILRAQDREFLYWTYPLPTDRDCRRFGRAWLAFCEEKKQRTPVELDAYVHRSALYRVGLAQFTSALLAKGFQLSEGPRN
jgi:hypothetical protein